MLKVQQYGARKISSRPFDQAKVQAPADNGLSSLSKGVSGAGNAIDEFDLKSSELAAEDALQGYIQETNDILLTGENAYYGTKGKDSVHGAAPTMQKIEGLKSKYLKGITRPEIQASLSKTIDSRYTAVRARIQTRSLDGQNEWDTSLAKTGIEQATEQAVRNIGEPSSVSAAMSAIKVNVAAANKGSPQDTINELAQNAQSTALRAGILVEMERSTGRAQGIFDKYREQMEVSDISAVEGKLKGRNDLQEISAASNDIRVKFGGSIASQRKAARAMFKGDIEKQDKLVNRVNNLYYQDEKDLTEAKRKNYESIGMDLLRKDPNNRRSLDDIVENYDLESLSTSQLKNLRGIEADLAKGKKFETNWSTYTQLSLMTDEEISSVNPMDYRRSLSEGQYKELVDSVKDARDGDATKLTRLKTNAAIYKEAEKDIPENNREDFLKSVQYEVSRKETQEKRKVGGSELNEIINSRLLETSTNWFSRNQRAYQLTIEDIPPSEKQLITNALIDRGMPTTEEEVLRLYQTKKAKEYAQ